MVRSVKIARELESWLFVTHNAQCTDSHEHRLLTKFLALANKLPPTITWQQPFASFSLLVILVLKNAEPKNQRMT